ncbi:MAG TPA: NAD(P)H-dependent oxidoreductase subunit E [Anaerolineales bacterium]|nr:NAD(P)H-dependent oxidoreductase subunit E [Anaerolineales bacterium]HRQ92325.1 NAD(P)H-dependent oxidoreductase subunit E [Anaerolineales bacterium]
MNPLRERYGQEIDDILAKYPQEQKRSAVMPLLYVAQREHGYVTREHLGQIGEILSIAPTEVASIVGFYTLYHDTPGGKYRLQICNDLPCALRGADKFLEGVCDHLGVKPGETTEDGVVTVEAVMCLAACDKAPMFQVQSAEGISYHENQTVQSTIALVDGWREEEAK